MEALRGRLSQAVELADQAAGAAENRADGLAEFVSPAATVALAYVHLERNELRQAHGQLKLAGGALRIAPDKLLAAIACLVAARCQLAEGSTKAASDMLSRAQQGWSPPRWLEHRLLLIQSRVWTAAGDVKAAVEAAARAEPASALDAAVTLAQAWLAAGDTPAAERALAAGAGRPDEPQEQVRLEGWLVDARLSYGPATACEAAGHSSVRCGWASPSGSAWPSPWSAPGFTRCSGAIPSWPTPTRTCSTPRR